MGQRAELADWIHRFHRLTVSNNSRADARSEKYFNYDGEGSCNLDSSYEAARAGRLLRVRVRVVGLLKLLILLSVAQVGDYACLFNNFLMLSHGLATNNSSLLINAYLL